ncbi:MAG: hypothetical protein ACUVQ1_04635 [Candidatus Kapaibacteriales bacterium]
MGNTVGKSNSQFFSNLVLTSFRWFIKGISAFFIFVIILFLLTEDFYDYSIWNLPLICQLLPFLVIFFGLVYSFFKPYVSGFLILAGSIFFWISTIITRNQIWLGWIFLIFPLTGILLITMHKLDDTQQNKQKKMLRRKRT